MSNVGKTAIRGHALRHEGNPRYDAQGDWVPNWWSVPGLCAKCECGALSEPGVSTYRGRKWHREHKDSLR